MTPMRAVSVSGLKAPEMPCSKLTHVSAQAMSWAQQWRISTNTKLRYTSWHPPACTLGHTSAASRAMLLRKGTPEQTSPPALSLDTAHAGTSQDRLPEATLLAAEGRWLSGLTLSSSSSLEPPGPWMAEGLSFIWAGRGTM